MGTPGGKAVAQEAAPADASQAASHKLTVAARDLFKDMEGAGEPISPFRWVGHFPPFFPFSICREWCRALGCCSRGWLSRASPEGSPTRKAGDAHKCLPLGRRFLASLHTKFPQFAERGAGGVLAQQDAEECWTQVLYTLKERLRDGSGSS